MKSPNSFTTIAAGALLFAAMTWLGWQMHWEDSDSETSQASPMRETRASSRSSRTKPNDQGAANAKRMLRAIENQTDPAERMRATTALVNSLTSDELLEWLDKRWFTSRDGFELKLFSQLATERLSHENPIGLLAWSIKDGSNGWQASLQTLTQSDPQALIDFFKGISDQAEMNPTVEFKSQSSKITILGLNSTLEFRALAAIAQNDPEMALERFIELSKSGKAQYSSYTSDTLLALAQASPKMLESSLESLDASTRKTAESALLRERLKSSFASEIQNLINQPDGPGQFSAVCRFPRADLGDEVLANLSRFPSSWLANITHSAPYLISRSNASQWLSADLEGFGLNAQQANSLRVRGVQRLLDSNPKQALQGLLDLDRKLTGESDFTSMLRNILINQTDETAAYELIEMIPDAADRETAENIINRSSSPTPDSTNPATTYQGWIEQVDRMGTDQTPNQNQLLIRAAQSLNQDQVSQLREIFDQLEPNQMESVAQILTSPYVSSNVDPDLKGKAIQYLISNSSESNSLQADTNDRSIRMASTHVVQWAQTDPTAASKWTATLPEGDAKSWATKNLANSWMLYDPSAAKKWIRSLPQETQQQVNGFLDTSRP